MTGSTNRIKVVGYAQRVFFNDNIEYRNFSPDLAGLQLTTSGGTALFTMGNFAVTTNYDPKIDKTFITNNFSNFVTLTDLNTTLENSLSLLLDNATVNLNLDKTDLTNYALFGSLTEFMRVSLEDIIVNWPAALYANPVFAIAPNFITSTGYTVENYIYNSLTNQSSFKVNVNVLVNRFQINYLANGNLSGTFNTDNSLRDLSLNYASYSIMNNGVEFDVLQFTGSTTIANDYLYFVVSGNAFSATTGNSYTTYYIKPNATQENLFYNGLPNFESYLLNRLSQPQFTSSFKYGVKSDNGNVLYITETVTWPTTDGYNIDFETVAYTDYAAKLADIATNFDLTTSGLMTRFLVSDSITDFDTTMTHVDPSDEDTSDQKMLKTLNIYGREFDDTNSFIKGLSFAHSVSYDKNNNTPDVYLKDLARNMGWDLISSVLELDLLKNYVLPNNASFSGHSVGLTAEEADTELWRRLILNTPWLWKSKGTRKSVEFLFKFIGTPLGLINFNEYVYVAQNQIDMNIFQEALTLNGVNTDLTTYPVDSDGYPSPLLNTSDLYFQSNGLWYRETGGSDSTVDITTGNNPHLGPYDGGFAYINQFRSLIPNFTGVTISSETTTTSSVNLFNNYNGGTMTSYVGNTYVDLTNDDGVDFSNCIVVTASIIEDPKHRQDETNCGCVIPSQLKSLSVCINKSTIELSCQEEIANIHVNLPYGYYTFDYNQFNLDGTPYMVNGTPIYYTTPFVDKKCCNFNGSIAYFYNQLDPSGSLLNSGYICCQATNTCGCFATCKWTLDPQKFIINPTDSQKYLVFDTELGDKTTTSFDGCNCLANYTTKTQITDPINGQLGYACQLTPAGLADLNSQNSIIIATYAQRAAGTIGCANMACILGLNIQSTGSVLGGTNGSITVTPSNGVGPYSYTWTDGTSSFSVFNISTPSYTISNLTNANYAITVGDSTTCSATTSVNVLLLACQLQLGTTVKGSTGSDGSVTVTVGGATGAYTIAWFAVASNNVRTPLSSTTITANNLTAGNYAVVVTDTTCSQTATVNVPVLDCSYLTLTMTSTQNSATAIVGGASGNLTYLWNNGATTATINNVLVGTYNVTVTDQSTGCQIQGTVDVRYTFNAYWIAGPSGDNGFLQPFAVLYYSVDGGPFIEQPATINRSLTSYITVLSNIRAKQSITLYITDKQITQSGFNYVSFGASLTPNFNFGSSIYCGRATKYSITLSSNQTIYLNLPTSGSATSGQDGFVSC